MSQDEQKEPELPVPQEGQSDADRERLKDIMSIYRPEVGPAGGESEVISEEQSVHDQAADQDGSFVPDVARVPEHDDLYTDSEDGGAKPFWKIPTLGWFVFGGILICITPIVIKVAFFSPPPLTQEVKEVQKAEKIQETQKSKRDEKEKDLLAKKEKAEKQMRQDLVNMNASVKGYLSADSIDQMVGYVRHPERVKPLMEQYYKDQQMVAEEFRRFASYRAIVIDNASFVIGKVEFKDGSTQQLLLEHLKDGSFKVDWESDVCYLSMAWDAFIKDRPTKPLAMRVYVQPDNFYAYDFRDDTQYDCYRLTTRDSDGSVFGYVAKGSEVSMEMRRFFMQTRQQGGGKVEPFTLVLRFPENSRSTNCVYIDQVLARRWVLVHESEAEFGE